MNGCSFTYLLEKIHFKRDKVIYLSTVPILSLTFHFSFFITHVFAFLGEFVLLFDCLFVCLGFFIVYLC